MFDLKETQGHSYFHIWIYTAGVVLSPYMEMGVALNWHVHVFKSLVRKKEIDVHFRD